jgi:hypothetical protein
MIVKYIDDGAPYGQPILEHYLLDDRVRYARNKVELRSGLRTPVTALDEIGVYENWQRNGVPQCVRDGEQANTSLSRFFTDANNL